MPEPGPDEALIRVLGVTTCPHWDIHMMNGEPMFAGQELTYPLLPGIPGHEAAGEVVATGAAVKRLKKGDRVVAWRDTGKPRPGFYAQFNTFSEDDLLVIPNRLKPAEVASLELAMCVEVSFQRLARVTELEGKRIGVCGLGPGGLVAVQLARAHGASSVVGLDPEESRREMATNLGADEVATGDEAAWPASRRDERALDLAVDCTGLAGAIEFLLDRTRDSVALFGVVRKDIHFAGRNMWGPGVNLISYGDHNKTAAETALAMIEAGSLRLRPLVSQVLPFTRYAEGIELLRKKEAIKIMFDPWSEK